MDGAMELRETGNVPHVRTCGGRASGEGEESCTKLLGACVRAAEAAVAASGDDPDLAHTLAELRLLCAATREAIALKARTSRELRLICAAICHLCAEQCSARPEAWAQRLARLCGRCAHACRQVVALPPPRVAA